MVGGQELGFGPRVWASGCSLGFRGHGHECERCPRARVKGLGSRV
jgi:hypothetical protein